MRKQSYENILDEIAFIARASEGAINPDWIQSQPIYIRKKYVEDLNKELKEREAALNKSKVN